SYELGLYAVVTLAVTTKVIDSVVVGINFTKAAHIISLKSDEVAMSLLTELDRGVTGLEGRGLYTGKRKEVLICVLKSRQVPKLKRIVRDIDPDAFVYLTDAREVFGDGFQAHE
ncbi:MAG: YitT family protein, partial [Spirochaetaceae bacterium]|nr:YitT family protein [Spirochaetaceae bacterium]